MIEIKNIFKKGNKNKLCYINIYTFVSLYWACYMFKKSVQKEENAISESCINIQDIVASLHAYINSTQKILRYNNWKKKKKENLKQSNTVCLIDHVKWIDKWIGTKTDVSRQVGKNLYARRGTYDSSLWTTLVLFVEKKKKKKKERMEDAQDLRLFLASNKRGEKMQPLWQIECDTMAGNRGITTFPDALRIFARVIVTCLRCYDCCLGMRTFFLFLFFLWTRKIEELLSRIYGETSRRSIIDSRIMETIFHWKCIHLQTKKEIQ